MQDPSAPQVSCMYCLPVQEMVSKGTTMMCLWSSDSHSWISSQASKMVPSVAVPRPGGLSQPLDERKLGSGTCLVLHTLSSSTALASKVARLEPTVTNRSSARSAPEAARPAAAFCRKLLYLPSRSQSESLHLAPGDGVGLAEPASFLCNVQGSRAGAVARESPYSVESR